LGRAAASLSAGQWLAIDIEDAEDHQTIIRLELASALPRD
jgi:hypothetical protein